jgi:hypothetical protein
MQFLDSGMAVRRILDSWSETHQHGDAVLLGISREQLA